MPNLLLLRLFMAINEWQNQNLTKASQNYASAQNKKKAV
jgi:hypothetical protein